MSLDLGELENRLRSLPAVPKGDGGSVSSSPSQTGSATPSAPHNKVCSSEGISEGVPGNPECQGSVPPSSHCQEQAKATCTREDDVGHGQEAKEPTKGLQGALPAKLKLSPFMGELNSRLQSRLLMKEGKKVDPCGGGGLPNSPNRPKIAPKPALSPKPKGDCSPTPGRSPFQPSASISVGATDVCSPGPAPVVPTVPCDRGEEEAAASATREEPSQTDSSGLQEAPLANGRLPAVPVQGVSSKVAKASFLQELKRKIFTGPKSPPRTEAKKGEGGKREEEEQAVPPMLSHSCAKHRLLVRPRKAHRLSYADFRRSRIIQAAELQQATDTVHSEMETETDSSPLAEDMELSSEGFVSQSPDGIPALSSPSDEKGDGQESRGSSSSIVEELQSPGGSSDDTSLFCTPPESPSYCSETDRCESTTTDTEFYSVFSELPLDAFDKLSITSEIHPDALETSDPLPPVTCTEAQSQIFRPPSPPSERVEAFELPVSQEHTCHVEKNLGALKQDLANMEQPDTPLCPTESTSKSDSSHHLSSLPLPLAPKFNDPPSELIIPNGKFSSDNGSTAPPSAAEDCQIISEDESFPCALNGHLRHENNNGTLPEMQLENQITEKKESALNKTCAVASSESGSHGSKAPQDCVSHVRETGDPFLEELCQIGDRTKSNDTLSLMQQVVFDVQGESFCDTTRKHPASVEPENGFVSDDDFVLVDVMKEIPVVTGSS